jgi:hypothetical protein
MLRTTVSALQTETALPLAGGGKNGDDVTLTASVSANGIGTMPTGTVNFMQDGNIIAQDVALVSGEAKFTVSGLNEITKHNFAVEYSGDTNYETASDLIADYSLTVIDEEPPSSEPANTEPIPQEPAPGWNNIAPPISTRNPEPIYTVLELTSNSEIVGILKFLAKDKDTETDYDTELYFETNRISIVRNYVKKRWDSRILGAFETEQKGGWGRTLTVSVSLEKLGFELDDGTKLYALIYDTKAKKWYEAKAEIIDGNIAIKTKRTGIVTIVVESVK